MPHSDPDRQTGTQIWHTVASTGNTPNANSVHSSSFTELIEDHAVTTPDDHDTKPEPSKPADKPEVWLPPRLRDKLTDAAGGDDDFIETKSSPVGLIITIVVALAAIGGVWWLIHSNSEKAKAVAAKAAADARAAVVADSLAQIATADSLAAVARADSIAFTKLPRAEQRRILAARAKNAAGTSAPSSAAPATPAASAAQPGAAPAGGAAAATPATPEPPKESGPYAVDAGEFLDQSMAQTTADALKGKVKYDVQVATMGEGDAATYHVLVGKFTKHSAADAAASDLLAKGLVEQAPVVPIPKAK
jgi:SPOR domain